MANVYRLQNLLAAAGHIPHLVSAERLESHSDSHSVTSAKDEFVVKNKS